ncbi:MAG: terminase TerL endonuclease subunit [Clostridiaceae bacterium]
MRKFTKYTPTPFKAKDSVYDKQAADHAVAFIECLAHTKGTWAGKPFLLIDWQEQIIRDVFGTLKPSGYRQFNTAYIEIPKKNGKQLALDTPIPTPDGWKQMGELNVGDRVFDEQGNPCYVLVVSEIDDTEQAYRLTFCDGSEIVAGARHLWNVQVINNGRREKLLETQQMHNAIQLHRAKCADDQPMYRIPVAPGMTKTRRRFHYICAIEPMQECVPMRCIQVSSTSHQYLAGHSMVPTHNSELAAAIALLLTCGDNEERAEVYGCAADRQQASIVFEVAKDMVTMCPALAKRVKILASQKRLVYLPTGSSYQVLSADVANKHGFNTHGVIFDELHTQPNRRLFDVMTKGSGDARMQPLYFLITTAGDNTNSICWEVHSKAKDILDGRKTDPTFYPVIYGTEENDSWTDPKVWKKANPSLGITVGIDKVKTACDSAQQNPAEENAFRQLRLNQWVKQAIRWMPMDVWDKCAFPIDPKSLEGRVCYGGLDLSSSTDITAFVLVFPPLDEDDKYFILPFFWIPEENIDLRVRRDHVNYDLWEKQGCLMTTEGNVVHYGFIETFIEQLGKKYNIRDIAFDRWGAVQMVQNLEGMGFSVIPFGQGFKDMSPPTKELMKLTLEQKIAHGGHQVLRWMMDNIYIRTDPAGNIKPDKEKSTEKIDGAVATIMALDRALRNSGGDNSVSVYDDRGILYI